MGAQTSTHRGQALAMTGVKPRVSLVWALVRT